MLISSIEKFKAARALLTSVIVDAEKQAAYTPDEPKYYHESARKPLPLGMGDELRGKVIFLQIFNKK